MRAIYAIKVPFAVDSPSAFVSLGFDVVAVL